MSENVIGKFCALGKANTLVYPKTIPGYTSPEPQVLTEDKQQIRFIYTPTEYNISYELDGGHFTTEEKKTFTIEDPVYIPPNPVKEDCDFNGWSFYRESNSKEIESVYGIGNVRAVANWRSHAILDTGETLHNKLESLSGDVCNIIAIQQAMSLIEDDYVNISCTETPILARYDSGIVYIYSESDIYCNKNMKGAFKDFIILRDVSALNNVICKKDTDISELFSGCALLSDVSPVEDWADGQFSSFNDAFKATAALVSGRVPEWYRWSITVNHMSSTGTIFGASVEGIIPGSTIYPKNITGYKPYTESILIDNPDKEYTFIYEPLRFNISYMVDGKETSVMGAATSYTIEDVSYYPPELSKDGYKFSGWSPKCIKQGEYGNVTFVANFIKV